MIKNIGIGGAAAALGFFLHIFLVKELGSAMYGKYVLFATACSLLFIFSRSGLDIVTLRRSAIAYEMRDRFELMEILTKALTLSVAFSIIATTIAYVAQTITPNLYSRIPIEAFWLLAGVTSMTVLSIGIAVIRGVTMPLAADAIDMLLKPALVVISVYLINRLDETPSFIAYMTFSVANLVSAIVCCVVIYGVFQRTAWKASGKKIGQTEFLQKNTALPLILYSLLTYVFFQADTLILAAYTSESTIAAYNMACNYVRLVIFVPMILIARSQPMFAVAANAQDRIEFFRLISYNLKTSAGAAIGASLILIVFGKWLLTTVDASFVTAYPSLVVLAVAHCINSIVIVLSNSMLMSGRHNQVVVSQLLGAAISIPLYFFAIPKFGMVGAAISVCFGLLATSVALSLFVFRSIKI
jgi:O-antigen/teichoic acid export membrane protein